MPIIEHRKVGTNAEWGIWDIQESMESLLSSYPLNETERSVFDSFTHQFRKTQWIAARLLLHTLLPDARITYDDHGKPWPLGNRKSISLSHSGTLIALMISDHHCGIDIETIRPKIERIAPKFLNAEELKEAFVHPNVERLHVYWCVKEAAYKLNGKKNISLRENIEVAPILDPAAGKTTVVIAKDDLSKKLTLHYERMGEYMLAWTEGVTNE